MVSRVTQSKHDRSTKGAVRVKGVNFVMLLEAVVRIYGPEARQRIEREATSELADALRFGGIVAGGWYDVSLYRSLWHLIGSQLMLDNGGIRRLTQKATALSVSGIYRALATITTPAKLVAMGAKLFGNYYDGARFEVQESRQGNIVCEWTQCVGFDSYLWNHVVGGAIYFLEAAGAKSVEYRVLDGGGDANRLRVAFTYR
jgi:hypothetical protein